MAAMKRSSQLTINSLLPLILALLLAASCGEDRSAEQPFVPSVKLLDAVQQNGAYIFTGEIVSSPNSRVLGCGFVYGNDTLTVDRKRATSSLGLFRDTVILEPGNYYLYAYATNGVGTTNSDTMIIRK